SVSEGAGSEATDGRNATVRERAADEGGTPSVSEGAGSEATDGRNATVRERAREELRRKD
ncbi:MAG: hypothetical protein J5I65_13460, partial [Aridibacter famidurans]|nr:hypothetical protein [Aridibacter famidurans]